MYRKNICFCDVILQKSETISNTMAETTEAKASASAPGGDAGGEDERRDERMLECNICLDTARDAVVSMCGHLFW